MNETVLLTKDSIITDILNRDDADDILPLFLEYGMHCIGCIASASETVGEACELHDINTDEFVRAANLIIAGKRTQEKNDRLAYISQSSRGRLSALEAIPKFV